MKNNKWMKGLFLVVSVLTISTAVLAEENDVIDSANSIESSSELETNNTEMNFNEEENKDNTDETNQEENNDSEKESNEKVESESNEQTNSESENENQNNSESEEKSTETETEAENNESAETTVTSGDSTSSMEDETSGDNSNDEKVKKYKVITVLEKGGKITPENPEIEEGKSQKFIIQPYEKYKITDVIIDGENLGSISSYTISDIKEDHKIEVKFLKVTNETKEAEKEWNNPFTDVKETDWYFDAVRYVNKHGLFNGISTSEFAPNSNVTRGMLVTVLFRFSNAIEYARATFDDVDPEAYYSQAISWASKNGIVNGVGDNKFAPEEYITRQDLATIIYRYARFKGKGFASSNSYLLDYADRDAIAEYAYEAMCWCNTTKVVNGKNDNMVDPTGLATRAETAIIMQRLADVFAQ